MTSMKLGPSSSAKEAEKLPSASTSIAWPFTDTTASGMVRPVTVSGDLLTMVSSCGEVTSRKNAASSSDGAGVGVGAT